MLRSYSKDPEQVDVCFHKVHSLILIRWLVGWLVLWFLKPLSTNNISVISWRSVSHTGYYSSYFMVEEIQV